MAEKVAPAVPIDILKIYVLWDPSSPHGARVANLIANHFDGLGMERDGVSFRVPVRFRTEPWSDSGFPREVDLEAAKHNAIVLLHDGDMHERRAIWDGYVAGLKASMADRGTDVYIPFGSPTRSPQLSSDREANIQYARRDLWQSLSTNEVKDNRLLLHLIWTIRNHLRTLAGEVRSEPLFVSHAKADGDDAARSIVSFVNDPSHDVPLDTFYDAMELVPGEDFEARFEREIAQGTLLALVSDAYDSRPWCVYELTIAKRNRRPIVVADLGKVRTSRTYPYGSNLPRLRVTPTPGNSSWIEPLLVQALSEGLRCDLCVAQGNYAATSAQISDAVAFPRPPELFDIIDASESLAACIVYPDPPLGRLETELLKKAISLTGRDILLRTVGELL